MNLAKKVGTSKVKFPDSYSFCMRQLWNAFW